MHNSCCQATLKRGNTETKSFRILPYFKSNQAKVKISERESEFSNINPNSEQTRMLIPKIEIGLSILPLISMGLPYILPNLYC